MVITWQSKPVYDGWGATPDLWKGNEWVSWGIELQKHFGVNEGNKIWSRAWLEGVSVLGGGYGTAPGANSVFDSVPIDDRSFNDTFIKFISLPQNGLLYETVFSGLGGMVGEVISGTGVIIGDTVQTVKDVVENVGDSASNATGSLATISKIIPWLLLAAGVFILYNISKNVKLKT